MARECWLLTGRNGYGKVFLTGFVPSLLSGCDFRHLSGRFLVALRGQAIRVAGGGLRRASAAVQAALSPLRKDPSLAVAGAPLFRLHRRVWLAVRAPATLA